MKQNTADIEDFVVCRWDISNQCEQRLIKRHRKTLFSYQKSASQEYKAGHK
jgi:hypothetical protein